MPRPTTIAIYTAVFGVALLAGLLIAALFKPPRLPTAHFTTPTAVSEALAASAQFGAAGEAAPVALAAAATAIPPTATREPAAASATAAPASTPQLSATATEPPAPTAIPTVTAAPSPKSPTPAPRPLVFSAQIVDQPTDAAVVCGAAFESRIWGVVKDRAGRGVYRAVVQISSADGQHHFSRTTNDQGGFDVPGLGCTTWVIQLISVPSAPGGLQAATLRVNLNGGKYSGAGVEFRQR